MLGLCPVRPAHTFLSAKLQDCYERQLQEPFAVMGTAGLHGHLQSVMKWRTCEAWALQTGEGAQALCRALRASLLHSCSVS